ncbi:SDR family NAD(P)-dependent oxidoreductase [Thermoflexibacter ruber]|uniref:NADP-dependent 3-hydroxy acid dehydrogenase YdfG n=1 Tax=Thermoflexibacter ruber TaxID=1003 RepID=A0A1I2E935_9BACT|nr:SDR family NAD(P)-dependent oxidoreductase [Thermoflexibacter ruber]SFE89001.1 NADP-dependent 3-hydroxy acid dehydrogenase YdfG [Thermoflexibacter ruber]
MKKIALITGATSGIGKATAELFAQHQIDLILCGRRQERLAELAMQLSQSVKVYTLCFDVRDKEEVFRQIENLPTDWKQIDVLVNNAGNAHGLAPVDKADLVDWEAMIDINVKGLMYVSKAVIPSMVERKSGHIINIGSIAGKEVYPNGNAYCASKYAVDALNSGMRLDLVQYGIKVTAINPGLVETEFSLVRFKGDEQRAKNVYKGITPLTAQDVAEVIYFAVSRPAHVNIADVILFPTAQASSTVVNRV